MRFTHVRSAGPNDGVERREMMIDSSHADIRASGDVLVGGGQYTALAVQLQSGLHDAAPGGFGRLGPLIHSVRSGCHLIDRLFNQYRMGRRSMSRAIKGRERREGSRQGCG